MLAAVEAGTAAGGGQRRRRPGPGAPSRRQRRPRRPGAAYGTAACGGGSGGRDGRPVVACGGGRLRRGGGRAAIWAARTGRGDGRMEEPPAADRESERRRERERGDSCRAMGNDGKNSNLTFCSNVTENFSVSNMTLMHGRACSCHHKIKQQTVAMKAHVHARGEIPARFQGHVGVPCTTNNSTGMQETEKSSIRSRMVAAPRC